MSTREIVPHADTVLRSLEHLRGYRVRARDGTLGNVADLLFLDTDWSIRYLVASTSWPLGRDVLLYTGVVGATEWSAEEFPWISRRSR